MNLYRLLWFGCFCCVSAFAQAGVNLIPNPEFHVDTTGKPISWEFWSPRRDLETRAEVANEADGAALQLAAVDFSSFGKWLAKEIPVNPGHFYRFEVFYKPMDIVNERGSVGVMLS